MHRVMTGIGQRAVKRDRTGEIGVWAEPLRRLLGHFGGALAITMPDGSSAAFGRQAAVGDAPAFSLRIRNPAVIRSLLLGRDPLRFAEAYFSGDIDVDGDLFAALTLKDQLHTLKLSAWERLSLLLRLMGRQVARGPGHWPALRAPLHANAVKRHSRQENQGAISFHYDLSNDFYGLWLDEGMVYSCAYFESEADGLAQAQSAKLDHICRKLRLQPGDRFLDIGCGWGALVEHAARYYGVQAHGITLSERQFAWARERIRLAGLTDRVTVALQDYRDLQGEGGYDKIASVGMFEHVGLKNLPLYFEAVQRLMRPDGLFLNHGITHQDEGWNDAISSRFINRYVFPDGELDTVGNIQRVMERSRFEVLDVEALRPHYAKTLRHWVHRLDEQHARALEFVDEATYRVWRLYMAASAMEFESGGLGIYQILAGRRGAKAAGLPSTRRYMYPCSAPSGVLAPEVLLSLCTCRLDTGVCPH